MRMKKITSITVAAGLLLFAGSVTPTFAFTCGEIDSNGVRHSCENGNPEMVTNVWGGTNSSVPRVSAGSTVRDEAGMPMLCPSWFGTWGCSDISRTDYYRNMARETTRQLQSGGFALGQYSYWLTH